MERRCFHNWCDSDQKRACFHSLWLFQLAKCIFKSYNLSTAQSRPRLNQLPFLQDIALTALVGGSSALRRRQQCVASLPPSAPGAGGAAALRCRAPPRTEPTALRGAGLQGCGHTAGNWYVPVPVTPTAPRQDSSLPGTRLSCWLQPFAASLTHCSSSCQHCPTERVLHLNLLKAAADLVLLRVLLNQVFVFCELY